MSRMGTIGTGDRSEVNPNGFCLGLHSAGGDEADGEVAEAKELDVVAFLEVLLHVVGVAVEDVLHFAWGGGGLGGNLIGDVIGGQ